MKVLGIGDNVCDVYVHQKRMYPGGQALNFAVNAKMLGAESEFLGVFGTDLIAACVKQALQTYGIPFPRSRTYSGDNGYARVTLDHGERVFLDSNKGGVIQTHPLRFDREDLDYIADFFLVHTTNNGFWIMSCRNFVKPESSFLTIFPIGGQKRSAWIGFAPTWTLPSCPAQS